MRAVIFGYFGTLTDPGAEEYREPLAHRTGELLGVCRPRFREALAGSFGERTIGVNHGTESTPRAVARSCGANPSSAQLPVAFAHLRVPRTSSALTTAISLPTYAGVTRAGSTDRISVMLDTECSAMMIGCVAATGLSRCDQRPRAAAAVADE